MQSMKEGAYSSSGLCPTCVATGALWKCNRLLPLLNFPITGMYSDDWCAQFGASSPRTLPATAAGLYAWWQRRRLGGLRAPPGAVILCRSNHSPEIPLKLWDSATFHVAWWRLRRSSCRSRSHWATQCVNILATPPCASGSSCIAWRQVPSCCAELVLCSPPRGVCPSRRLGLRFKRCNINHVASIEVVGAAAPLGLPPGGCAPLQPRQASIDADQRPQEPAGSPAAHPPRLRDRPCARRRRYSPVLAAWRVYGLFRA